MAFEIHAHERRKLHEAWIDLPRARPYKRRELRQIRLLLEPIRSAFAMAKSLTLVGLMRVSIGPAIKVMLRGCAASPSSAINAAAARTGTQGWQTATTWEPGPITCRNLITWSTKALKSKRAVRERHISNIMPVGDIDVVVGNIVLTVARNNVAK